VLFEHTVWKITSCFEKFELNIGENSANKLTTNFVTQIITWPVMTRLFAGFCEDESWRHFLSHSRWLPREKILTCFLELRKVIYPHLLEKGRSILSCILTVALTTVSLFRQYVWQTEQPVSLLVIIILSTHWKCNNHLLWNWSVAEQHGNKNVTVFPL